MRSDNRDTVLLSSRLRFLPPAILCRFLLCVSHRQIQMKTVQKTFFYKNKNQCDTNQNRQNPGGFYDQAVDAVRKRRGRNSPVSPLVFPVPVVVRIPVIFPLPIITPIRNILSIPVVPSVPNILPASVILPAATSALKVLDEKLLSTLFCILFQIFQIRQKIFIRMLIRLFFLVLVHIFLTVEVKPASYTRIPALFLHSAPVFLADKIHRVFNFDSPALLICQTFPPARSASCKCTCFGFSPAGDAFPCCFQAHSCLR